MKFERTEEYQIFGKFSFVSQCIGNNLKEYFQNNKYIGLRNEISDQTRTKIKLKIKKATFENFISIIF